MARLGDVLEVMQASHPWATLQVSGVLWLNPHRQRAAREIANPASKLTHAIGCDAAGGAETEEIRDRWSLWRSEPDQMRSEYQAGEVRVTAVWHGAAWWSWDPARGLLTNDGDPNHQHGAGPGEVVIGPAQFLPELDLTVNGTGTRAGRQAYELMGRPRTKSPGLPLFLLGSGADQYLLSVDAERGLLLRSEARLREEPIRVVEVEQVTFDAVLPGELFLPSLLPPPG